MWPRSMRPGSSQTSAVSAHLWGEVGACPAAAGPRGALRLPVEALARLRDDLAATVQALRDLVVAQPLHVQEHHLGAHDPPKGQGYTGARYGGWPLRSGGQVRLGTDAERLCGDSEGRVHSRGRREEAAVDHPEVLDVVGP